MWNTQVTGLAESAVVADMTIIQSRWVIGADGSRSRMRRWSGLESAVPQRSRFAFRLHYRAEPWRDFTEIHWGEGAKPYVTPVGAHEICLVLISNKPNARFDETLRRFPKLLRRLKGALQTSSERGAVTSMFQLKGRSEERRVGKECRSRW